MKDKRNIGEECLQGIRDIKHHLIDEKIYNIGGFRQVNFPISPLDKAIKRADVDLARDVLESSDQANELNPFI